MNWGPYRDAAEARLCTTSFSDTVSVRRMGILWSAGDDAMWLRSPVYDSEGFGLSLLFRYDDTPPHHASGLERAVERLDHFLGGALTTMGQAEIQTAQAQLAASQAGADYLNRHVLQPLNAFIGRHEAAKDGIGLALDISAVIAGVVAGGALLAGGLTIGATIGLALGVLGAVGGAALAVEDARHLWFVMTKDEAGKLDLEHSVDYRWITFIGPLLAIPDLAMSGRAALRELTAASRQGGRAGRLTEQLGRSAGSDAREYRQLLADREQSAGTLLAARQHAELRAAQYRRLLVVAQRINRDLALKRNAVLSYGGAAYGAGMYALQPPEFARALIERLSQRLGHGHAQLGPYALLAPEAQGARGHFQVTAVVATRGGRSR